jgi:raffinose/stachyose/melibiose transport system substrate-binding protein
MKKKIMTGLMGFLIMFLAAGSLFANGGSEAGKTNAAGKKITLTWFEWAENVAPYPNNLIEAFEKQNPGVTVNYETGSPEVSQYLNTQKIRFLSGEGMDITTIRPESYNDYVKAGYLAKLDGDPCLDAFTQKALDSDRVDGSVYAIPGPPGEIGVYYNKDMFKKLGLSVPTNWNEFISVLDKIKAAGIIPMMAGGKEGWPMEFDVYPIIDEILVKDRTVFDKIAKGQAKYTDPEWVNAFNRIKDFYAKGYVGADTLSIGDSQACTYFLQGKVALYMNGDWAMRVMSGKDADGNDIVVPFEIGVFPMPHNMPGEKQVGVVQTGTGGMAISAKSKNIAMAKKFLQFFVSPEAQEMFTKGRLSYSSVKGAPTDFSPMAHLWKPILNMPDTVNYFYSLQNPAVNTEMLKQLQLMFQNKATPEQALQAIQAAQDSLKQ